MNYIIYSTTGGRARPELRLISWVDVKADRDFLKSLYEYNISNKDTAHQGTQTANSKHRSKQKFKVRGLYLNPSSLRPSMRFWQTEDFF